MVVAGVSQMVVLGEWANLRIAGTLVTIVYFFFGMQGIPIFGRVESKGNLFVRDFLPTNF